MVMNKIWLSLMGLFISGLLITGCGGKEDDSDTTEETTTITGGAGSSGTSVSLSGSLALSGSGSGTGLSLTATDLSQYTLRCVTLEGDIKACKDQLDADGSFTMECEGFKNVAWGGFLLDADGNVAGSLSSSQLINAGNTEMGLVFDPTTGLLSIKSLIGKDDSGAEVAASTGLSVDDSVKNLSIKSGNYGFCFKDLSGDDIQKAHKGDLENALEFGACPGRTEQLYVKFSPFDASANRLPAMEIWESEAKRNNCYVNDTLTYHISDGTRSLEFTDKSASFNAIFDSIYNNGTSSWVPAAAVEAYQISLNETAGEKDDNAEMKANLENIFGAGKACTGIVDALIEAYNKTSLVSEKGFKRCNAVVVETGNSEFDSEMNQPEGGPPKEWCAEYLQAADDTQKTTIRNRFVAECKAHIEGSGGESLWQKQGLVWEFLHILAEARHEGGDGRYAGLRDAFDLVEEEGISLTSEDLASMSTTCVATAAADKALAALAIAWSEVDHNWERQRFLDAATDDQGQLICSTISVDNFGNSISYSNGRDLIKKMLSSTFHDGETNTGLADLKHQICEDSHEMDLSGIDTSAAYFTDFWSNIDTSGHEPKFKSTVTDKDTPFLAFVNHLLDNSLVRGCTKTHITNVKNSLSSTSVTGGGSSDEYIRWIGWQILDQKRRTALADLNTSPTAGTSPLTALDSSLSETARAAAAATELPAFATKVANLAISDPMRFGWLLMDLCHFVDLGTLTLTTSLSCGAALPEALNNACVGGGGSCTLPAYTVRSEAKNHLLADLARRITEMKGRDAFHSDKSFKEKIRAIKANSRCLPDASLSRNPVLDADSNLVFEVDVRAPVSMIMNGDVNKEPSFRDTASESDLFHIESARIEEEKGGMGSQGCYWGEIKRLTGVAFDAAQDVFRGNFTEAFVDTCRNANSSDSGDEGGDAAEHAWHRSFVATFEPTGSKTQ